MSAKIRSMLLLSLPTIMLVGNAAAFLSQDKFNFGQHRYQNPRNYGSNYCHCKANAAKILTLKAAEIHTAYEYIARQRGSPTTDCITWIDPSENIVPDLPQRQMGFDISLGSTSEDTNNESTGRSASLPLQTTHPHFRLPVYPVGAVHLPSDATHKLHNTQLKNIRMARDLKSDRSRWNVRLQDFLDEGSLFSFRSAEKNTDTDTDTDANAKDTDANANQNASALDNLGSDAALQKKRQCFVLTLLAQDTHRIANIGTLVEVTHMEETLSNYDQSVLRIVVECRALGTVNIDGFEEAGVKNKDEYLVGNVRLLEGVGVQEVMVEDHHNHNNNSHIGGKEELIEAIVQDYAAVRKIYTGKDGVASGELPPWARDAVQANLPTYTKEDFISRTNFWNIADSWQMLCNTVTVARRSDLQTEMNEIMVEAASKQKGPLKLPIKREKLPDDVQALLRKMEQETSEDFISCGLDSCLDFQVLMGMKMRMRMDGGGEDCNDDDDDDADDNHVHEDRLRFLGGMIQREKYRLQAKQRLKTMFEGSSVGNSTSSSSSSYFGGGSGGGSNDFE